MLALCPPEGHGPLVIALAGLPGAGKSTLAARLASSSRWALLDRDAIREQRHPGDASAAARLDADQQLWRRVGSGLLAGLNLLVDGKTFADEADRQTLAETVMDGDGRLQWCWIDVPTELAVARVCAQGPAHPAQDRDAALVRQIAARFQPFPESAWRLNGCMNPDELERELLARIAARMRALMFED